MATTIYRVGPPDGGFYVNPDTCNCDPNDDPNWNCQFIKQMGNPPSYTADTSAGDQISGFTLDPSGTAIFLNNGVWTMQVCCDNEDPTNVIWIGTLTSGTGPAGPYARGGGSDSTDLLIVTAVN